MRITAGLLVAVAAPCMAASAGASWVPDDEPYSVSSKNGRWQLVVVQRAAYETPGEIVLRRDGRQVWRRSYRRTPDLARVSDDGQHLIFVNGGVDHTGSRREILFCDGAGDVVAVRDEARSDVYVYDATWTGIAGIDLSSDGHLLIVASEEPLALTLWDVPGQTMLWRKPLTGQAGYTKQALASAYYLVCDALSVKGLPALNRFVTSVHSPRPLFPPAVADDGSVLVAVGDTMADDIVFQLFARDGRELWSTHYPGELPVLVMSYYETGRFKQEVLGLDPDGTRFWLSPGWGTRRLHFVHLDGEVEPFDQP